MYWRLLDAWTTELTHQGTTRHSVREELEGRLDKMRPEEERLKDHGAHVSGSEWARLKKQKRKVKSGDDR